MPATVIDSEVFRDMFSAEEYRKIFSDEQRVQYYLDIEKALAKVQAELGIIPKKAATEIARHGHVDRIDMAKLKSQTELIGYPVLGVVEQLVGLCKDNLGQWCHWGATTQDITDSATVLQIRDAFALIERDLDTIAGSLAKLAKDYRDTPMAGRSNLKQAVPVTFGYKAAVVLAGIQRHLERLNEIRPRVLTGEFGGACGNLSSLGHDGLKVQAALMDELGLGHPEIAWHTMRDRIAEAGCFLGLVCGTLGKLALDVKLMDQTEIGEIVGPPIEGRGSSSTMPQKHNPLSCVLITACNSMVRQQVAALLDAMVEDHERATGPWEVEWIAVPEIFCLAGGVLAQGKFLTAELEVRPENMKRNLELTGGLIVSEAVMMGLGPTLGRARAHDIVYDICHQVVETGKPFLDLLAANEEIAKHMSRDQLASLVDPANYLGLCGQMVDNVLARETKRAKAHS